MSSDTDTASILSAIAQMKFDLDAKIVVKVDELKLQSANQFKSLTSELASLSARVTNTEKSQMEFGKHMSLYDERLEKVEIDIAKTNLIIYGIQFNHEQTHEELILTLKCEIKNIFGHVLGINIATLVSDAYPLETPTAQEPRKPTKVIFKSLEGRNLVFNKRSEIKAKYPELSITDNVPKTTRVRRAANWAAKNPQGSGSQAPRS